MKIVSSGWFKILKPLKQFLVYQGSYTKHCEARAWAGQPGLSAGDMGSASTWRSTKGISWSPSKEAIIHREGERALDSGISVPAWGLDYSLCPGPGLVANIFQMKSFHNGWHQAAAGREERDEVVTPAERNIHLTEYLVYQICKCRVLEYFVCAHLKFGNI